MGPPRRQVRIPPHVVLSEESHVTSRSADIGRVADRCGAAERVGTYLTNGVFLYRVVDLVMTDSGETAAIEDCYQLDVVRVPVRELVARRLRVVRVA
jgi:hypothetical protein